MDGVRQRHARSPSSSGFHSRTRSVMKNLDLFPKVHDDYVIRTKEGGISWNSSYIVIYSVSGDFGYYGPIGSNGVGKLLYTSPK